MATTYSALAALIVVAHLLFVVFAVGGGLLALRWRWMPWLHVPAALWAAYIELSGGICPLTPLENALRARGGLDAYSGDFIARYVFPMLYPSGLTYRMQLVIGLFVLLTNIGVYFWLALRAARRVRSVQL